MENVEFAFQIKQYLRIINKRKWVIIFPLLVIPTLAFVWSFFLPRIYEAKSTILIREKKIVSPLMKNLVVSSTLAERIEVLKQEILAWPRLLLLIERLKLNSDLIYDKDSIIETLKFKVKRKMRRVLNMGYPDTKRESLFMERLVLSLKKEIKINMKGDEIVVISYNGKDPAKTQALVNTLCDILIEKNLESQKKDTGSAIDFIKDQLDIYKDKLDKSEDNLRKFKEVYGDVSTSEKKPQLEKGADGKEYLVRAESYLDGVTLAEINKQLVKFETGLIFSSVDYTEEHPKLKEMHHKIEILKKKRDEYIEKMARKIGAKPEEFLVMADSIPSQQEALERLRSDNAINSKIYGALLERLETAKITERLDSSSNRTKFRVIEPARFPMKPIKPDRVKILLFGIMIALAAGGGMVYYLEFSDSSFKTEEQLEEAFGIPVLGVISKIDEGRL